MRMHRVKCDQCGLEATRFGSEAAGLISVDSDECLRLCATAAEARARGEEPGVVTLNCPHLSAALPVESTERA